VEITETVFAERWPTDPVALQLLKPRHCNRLQDIQARLDHEWLQRKLYSTELDLRWAVAHIWGNRLFDYYECRLGVAVMLDPQNSTGIVNSALDRWNWDYSAIRVFHVRAWNEDDAAYVLSMVRRATTLKQRRVSRGW